MPDIPTIVTSINTRLDELATEIKTLEEARVEVHARELLAASPAAAADTATPSRRSTRTASPRPARATKTTSQSPARAAKTTSPRPARATKTTPSPRGARSRPAVAGDTVAPAARPAAALSAEDLQRHLAGAPSGLSTAVIAERAGVTRPRALALLRELETAGAVRRTGERRSVLWLAVTDEDRVAQRAAELERQFTARRGDRTQRRGRARAS